MVLGILWIVCFLNYADRQAISSLFPLLERDFGFSKAELGLIGSTFMWVYAISSPFAGVAGDRKSRKGLILSGCLFWSLMTGLTGLCGKFWQFMATRSLIGLGESVYFPSATSLLSSYHGKESRSTALSLHQTAVYLGTIAGGGIAALIGECFGWRGAFYFFGLLGVLVALAVGQWLREPPLESVEDRVSKKEIGAALWSLMKRRGVMLLVLAFACANAVGTIFLVWSPTFLFEKFHLGLAASGFSAVAAIQLASAVSCPISGLLADWLSIKISGARMLVQALSLVLGAVCVVAVGHAASIPALIAAMICFGLCKGGYDGGIFASVFEFVEPHERASVAGLMNFIGWGGGAIGPLAIGLVSTYGHGTSMQRMSTGIAWSGLAYLVAAVLVLCAFKYQRTSHSRSISSGVEERL